MTKPMTRVELDSALAAVAAVVPTLQDDMSTFFEEFESRALQIEDRASSEGHAYLAERLQEIIDGAGINATFE